MFAAREFTFAGRSSRQYGLTLCEIDDKGQSDIAFGNAASIIEDRVIARIQPVHFGVNYHASPLRFKLVFGAERKLNRFELDEISAWLTGYQNYQWLTIDQPDLNHVMFRCLVTSLTPVSAGGFPVAFEAEITCDCPYAYGLPFEEAYSLTNSQEILFRNPSPVREFTKPKILFTPEASVNAIKIVNRNDNDRIFFIENLPSNISVEVDNSNCIIRELRYGYNLYGGFNMNFFRLVPGDNHLYIEGAGLLKISGRFFYNVAA